MGEQEITISECYLHFFQWACTNVERSVADLHVQRMLSERSGLKIEKADEEIFYLFSLIMGAELE